MSGRRAAAAVLAMIVLLPPIPSADAAETFGALTVTASDWRLLSLPPGQKYTQSLFQIPGDLDGGGFDDVVLWLASSGFKVARGGAGGLEETESSNHTWGGACVLDALGSCSAYGDAGHAPALDSRPTGSDTGSDGRADLVLSDSGHAEACAYDDNPECEMDAKRVLSFNGSSGVDGVATIATRTVSQPPSLAYLIGPAQPSDSGAALIEQPFGRGGNGSAPAYTQFTLMRFKNGVIVPLIANGPSNRQWTQEEPLPLGPNPRQPLFLAAPDFEGDGLADIVTWSPPAPGPNTAYPGVLTIYNGSTSGPNLERPSQLHLFSPEVLLADFDGDGHIDVATYRLEGGPPGTGMAPHLHVEFRFWHPDGFHGVAADPIDLAGPSIFLTQPSIKLQAGDVDGDGRADLVTAKYDTTSASAGHVLVDVFLARQVMDCNGDGLNLCMEWPLAFSTEIALSGSDIYTGEGGLRLNLQGDFDGDGLRDITVGYYGGNAPDRGRTSSSGFVAVLYGWTVMRFVHKIWIDTEPGGAVLPLYRNYTIHFDGAVTTGDSIVLRININGLIPDLHIDVNQTGPVVVSSAPDVLSIDGESVISRTETPQGDLWNLSIPVRFNWSLTTVRDIGLEAYFFWGRPGEHFSNPKAARFDPRVEILGPLVAESDGRLLESGGWSRAGAPINFSNLNLVYSGLKSLQVAPDLYRWAVRDGAGLTLEDVAGGPLAVSEGTPAATTRGLVFSFGITGLFSATLVSPLNFTISVDGDVPQFGDHLPLESEWVTSSPAMVAVEIFDNESGVDPSRIEVSWENDGAPFVRWDRATALPGETAAQVVGRAFIRFPEGNLSTLIWRVWDNVGNGPVESPIFGIKVDTQDISFHDPWPAAAEWQNETSVGAGVWLRTGSSGLKNGSLEYRASTSGIFGFGPWQSQCPPPPPPPPGPVVPGGCLRLSRQNADGSQDLAWGFGHFVSLVLLDGDNNWIQWRAENNAGSGSRISDPYQIRVDSLPVVISAISPNKTTLFPLGPVSLVVTAHEGSPEGVAQRGIDTAPGHSTFRIRGPGQLQFGPAQLFPTIIAGLNNWSAEFRASLALQRGNSTVEVSVREIDGRTTTAETVVRINQAPTVTVISDPANFTVLIHGSIALNASASDPDGQGLRYSWGPCPPATPREPPRPPEFSRNATLTLSTTSPEPLRTTSIRTISFCVTVFDTMDGVARVPINVSVVETLPPPPVPPESPPAPAPPIVSVLSPEADAFFFLVLLLAAAGAAAALLVLRRRRLPPDNL